MIDEPDDVLDFQVASHIVNVHQKKDLAFSAPYSMTQIQRYIKFARSLKPRMTPEVKSFPATLDLLGLVPHGKLSAKSASCTLCHANAASIPLLCLLLCKDIGNKQINSECLMCQ